MIWRSSMDNYNNNYNGQPDPGYNQPNYNQPNYNQPNLNYSPPNYSADAYLRQTSQQSGQKTFGIISLVCGLIGLPCACCCGFFGFIFPIVAIVCGILSINKHEDKDAKGMAIAGIICGGIGILIVIITLILGFATMIPTLSSLSEYGDMFEDLY